MRKLAARLLTAAAIVTVVFVPRAPAAPCTGDLDADGQVHVDEVVHMVGCALTGRSGDAPCMAAPIDDLVQAVRNAIYGCETVWMAKPACYQCEPCEFAVVGIPNALDQVVAQLEAEGVTVIDASVQPVGITCLACGICPAGFYFVVLVPERDRAHMMELGWR